MGHKYMGHNYIFRWLQVQVKDSTVPIEFGDTAITILGHNYIFRWLQVQVKDSTVPIEFGDTVTCQPCTTSPTVYQLTLTTSAEKAADTHATVFVKV